MTDAEVADVTHRTRLAAERTRLAWWRSGIAAATAPLAVGGLGPELVEGAGWPYVALGCGYALAAATMFALGALSKGAVDRALATGTYAEVPLAWTTALSHRGEPGARTLLVLFA